MSSTNDQSDSVNSGRVVAVDDVDPRGALLGQQRRPLERALAAAHDQHAPAAEPLEVDRAHGVRPLLRREPLDDRRRLDRELGNPGSGHHPVGDDLGPVVQVGGEGPVLLR